MEIGRRDLTLGAISVGFFGDLFAGVQVGKPAPPFTITTFDKRRFTKQDLAGKVVVLNFWATWCAPCRVELPMIDRYLREHPTDDLALFAVATEGSVPNAELRPLAKVLSFPLALRISSAAYGPIGGEVPTNFVIDRAGIVRWARAGAFTEVSFGALVQPLLAQPAPAGAGSSSRGTSKT